MKLFIFILLTCSALNPVLVYSSCKEAFVPTASVQEKAQKSVWKVTSLYLLSTVSGTGFFIGPSTLVTNVHVVSKALKLNRINIILTQKDNPRILKVKAIKHLSVTYDLAVLEIEGEVSDYLKQGIPSSQENLFSISYPKGNFKVIKKTGDIFHNSEFDYTFPGNSSDSLGASGSPVLNTNGEVVGVLHAQNENALHAVKIIHLQNLLKQKVEFFRSPKDHLEHSIKEAIEAAKQGHAPAQDNLATFYRQGIGVKQDHKKSVYWFEKAAEQGYTPAQGNLGFLYHLGHGVKQDHKTAVYWYKEAAEQGYILAQYNLAILYENGYGVKQDHKKAVYWFEKAAEQGHAPAQFALAVFYQNGSGVKQDYQEAIYWYKKAADQGDVNAQNSLAVFYMEGRGPGVKQYIKKLLSGIKKLSIDIKNP